MSADYKLYKRLLIGFVGGILAVAMILCFVLGYAVGHHPKCANRVGDSHGGETQ